jgi:hypothetical protein
VAVHVYARLEGSLHHRLTGIDPVAQHVEDRLLDGAALDAEKTSQVSLGIQVDQEDPVAQDRETGTDIHDRRRLADAAFVIEKRRHFGLAHVSSPCRGSGESQCGPKPASSPEGGRSDKQIL